MDDAIELLFKASNTHEKHQAEKRSDAKAVVELLTQHALAVVQAGAYINLHGCTFKEYAELFQEQRKSLLSFGDEEASSRYRDVYTTFEVSAKLLKDPESANQTYANALELLGVLCHLYFIGVPQAMFARAWKHEQRIIKEPPHADDIECLSSWHVSKLPMSLQGFPPKSESHNLLGPLHYALEVLRSFAIITIHPETKDISMHPLAHAWARDRLDEHDKSGAWACTMSLIALSLEFNFEYRDFWLPLQPHIEACIDAPPKESFKTYPAIDIGRMSYQFAWLFYRVNNYPRCKELTTKLRKKFGSEDSSVMNGSSIGYLHAICLQSLEEYRPAQEILEGIVKSDQGPAQEILEGIMESGQGPGQEILEGIVKSDQGSTTATSKIQLSAKIALADIYLIEGDGLLVINTLREVLLHKGIIRESSAETNPHAVANALLSALNSIVYMLSVDRRNKGAISVLQAVVHLQNSIFNPTHHDRLAPQHKFALKLSGDHKDAIFHLRKLVEIQDLKLNPEHPTQLAAQHELAVVLSADGNYREAIPIIQGVIQKRNSTLDPTHHNLLASKYLLVSIFRKMGKGIDALKIINEVVIIVKRKWDASDERRRDCELLQEDCLAYNKRISNVIKQRIKELTGRKREKK